MASSSHTDSKQLRNDLLTLVSLVAKISPDAPFIVSLPPIFLTSYSLFLPLSTHAPQETGFVHSLCSYFLSFEGTYIHTLLLSNSVKSFTELDPL